MIVDSFLFFQELEILLIRLEYLYKIVDKFIIVEAKESFTGKEKGFIFEKNIKLFEKYLDKIYYFKISDTHKSYESLIDFLSKKDQEIYKKIQSILLKHDYYDKQKLHYVLDTYHRECLHIPMSKICKNDDLIIISDLDEIPKDEILKNIGNFKKPLVCRQNEFKYYLNLYSNNKWKGSIIDRYSVIKNKSLNILRKESNKFNILYPGGYHFTSIGKENEIINKIENWGHQEYNRKFIKNNVHKNIIKGRDIFYRIGEKKNIVIDLENSKIFDQNMARIIKNKNLILVSRKKESIFEKFEYRVTQIIFYLIRAQEEPLQFIKKILFKLKILK